MIIDGRQIGAGNPPYIVAEISCNHNGDLGTALKLIAAAKNAGADAVKFQAYVPGTITIKHDSADFLVRDGEWKGEYLWDLYVEACTPFDWFPKLFKCAKETGITMFASVFDKTSVDMLKGLGCPAYKIASMEIVDTPLITYAAKTGKPIIISTGMASKEEIHEAAFAVDAGSLVSRAFLHCVSGYPTRVADYNLRGLAWLMKYAAESGISDHTTGIEIPIAATAMGAAIIEKHLMIGDIKTLDYKFSMRPKTFKEMCRAVRNVWSAMQVPIPGVYQAGSDPEEPARQFRRSLYVVKDISQGEAFTEQNVRSIRPSYGLPPGELQWVLTKRAACHLITGTPLKKDHAA